MPVHNSEISDVFNEIADLLELEGANEFRIRAYRNAARTVAGLGGSCADMIAREQELSELPGIGKDLAGKIRAIVSTGKLPMLEELRIQTPAGLRQMMRIPGLGAKRIRILRKDLGIESIEQLRTAAEKGSVHEHSGFGETTEKHILQELKRLKGAEVRETFRRGGHYCIARELFETAQRNW